MAHKPVGDGIVLSTSTGSAQTTAQAHKTETLRVVTVGADAFVAIGVNPTATNTNYYVPSGGTATISIGPPQSNRVVAISTSGTSTIIDFPEGTGSPFGVGDAVSLTATNQSYWDFSHKTVSSVNNTADQSGYFNTRIVVDNDYGVGYAHTALDATNPGYSWAELRGSFKVAALTSTGTGTIYAQQVQVTGDA